MFVNLAGTRLFVNLAKTDPEGSRGTVSVPVLLSLVRTPADYSGIDSVPVLLRLVGMPEGYRWQNAYE